MPGVWCMLVRLDLQCSSEMHCAPDLAVPDVNGGSDPGPNRATLHGRDSLRA